MPWLVLAWIQNCEFRLSVEPIFQLAARAPSSHPRAMNLVRSGANFVFAHPRLAFFRIVSSHGSSSSEIVTVTEIRGSFHLEQLRVAPSNLDSHYAPVPPILSHTLQ